MGRKLKYLRVCPIITVIFFLILILPDPNDIARISAKERLEYLRKGQAWRKVDIAGMNILSGPKSTISVPAEAEVHCHYVEEKIEAGATPKFKCRVNESGEVVRVKFSRRETYSEVAGTRLLWALGFYSDEAYPVKLRCHGCEELYPSDARGEIGIERVINDAVMELNFPGEEIGQFPDQGWKWSELDRVDAGAGGATRAQLDGLKLLAVFIQHNDSKPAQQRLACFPDDLQWQNSKLICAKPVLMIQDLGATFGTGDVKVGRFSAMYFKGWERRDIWNVQKEDLYLRKTGRRACFGLLTSAFDNGLIDPEISEEGRRFLAGLLNRLSDDQIRDLFRVARAEQTDEVILENGREIPVTVEHWLAAFKKKREQINQHRCL